MKRKLTYKGYHARDPLKYPLFRYHPDPIGNGVFVEKEGICACCKEKTELLYEGPFFSDEEIEGICPACIANGTAAARYDLDFASNYPGLKDEQKNEELMHHTPSYWSYTFSEWLSHCDDWCAYLGEIDLKDVSREGLEKELEKDPVWEGHLISQSQEPIQIHLFRCLHCGKQLLRVDEWFD